MFRFRRKDKVINNDQPEEIKNYYADIEKMKIRNQLKLDRWQYLQYLKLQREIKTKTKKELGMMLCKGYKGACWHVINDEYKQRQNDEK